jgi:hypothetical protein
MTPKQKIWLLAIFLLLVNIANASSITGNASPCVGQVVSYTYDGPLTSGSYNNTVSWTLPGGTGYFTNSSGSTNNGTSLDISDGATSTVYVKYTGSNTFYLEVNNTGGSSYTAALSITVYDFSLSVTPTSASITSGQSVTLQASTSLDSYSWGCNISNCNFAGSQTSSSVTVSPSSTATYTVTAEKYGCPNKSVSVTVSTNALTCLSSLNLTGNITTSDNKTYGTLTATNVTIGSAATVVFRGQKVVLNPTFKALGSNGKFTAQINPCLSGTRISSGDSEESFNEAPKTSAIYPNPSDLGLFQLDVSDKFPNIEIEIYNQLGNKVTNFTSIQNTTYIDLSKEAPGVYLAKVNKTSGNETFKLIYQK